MNETILVSEKNTSVSLPENTRTHLQDCRDVGLKIVTQMRVDILAGKQITLKHWSMCKESLDSVEELLRTAPGVYQRVLPMSKLWDVTHLHDDVLFGSKSNYAFFVRLFETDEQIVWYFCTESQYVVVVDGQKQCMQSYNLHQLPMYVRIEDRKMLSSVAILNGIEKAIQAGFTTQCRLTMRDHVIKN